MPYVPGRCTVVIPRKQTHQSSSNDQSTQPMLSLLKHMRAATTTRPVTDSKAYQKKRIDEMAKDLEKT